MPGLRGNLCWGNRGSFTIYGEYPSAGFDPTDRHVAPAPETFVSTSAYYGHHRVPTNPPPSEQMDVTEAPTSEPPTWTETAVSRKRLHTDAVYHPLKRIRQDGKQNLEEEDLHFMEHFLKQTHGCDYYSFVNCN